MEKLKDLIDSEQPVLVDFYADWCGPCKAMSPVIQQVARDLGGKARIVKVNVDKNVEAAQQYNVSGVPTFILFRKGMVLWRHSGTIDYGSLLKVIHQRATVAGQV
ncbi:MAG: thioredoxin [Bacteroidetes bacterium]|nr:thioredoxin [Bacteroidota bacterium]